MGVVERPGVDLAVIAPVVLADQPALGQQQVGHAQDDAVLVDDVRVAQRRRQARVHDPQDAQPGLPDRTCPRVGQRERLPHQGHAPPSG
jgi:hypothetical protein